MATEDTDQEADVVLDALCIGGGNAYVGHGDDVVLLAFTRDVGWWRNSVGLTPDSARRLASILTQQADAAEEVSDDRPVLTTYEAERAWQAGR